MKMRLEHEVFNFWKGNKIAGFFQLTKKQLIKEFEKWLPSKNIDWLEYYSTSDVINSFVTDGLKSIGNSENDFAEYRAMEKLLKPIKREYITEIKRRIDSIANKAMKDNENFTTKEQ